MGIISKWREKHPKRVDPYDDQERRLHEYISKLECGTDEFREAQKELAQVNTMRRESKDSKCRLTREAKGNLALKIVGGLGLLGAAIGIGAYESKGMTFTGEKRSLMDTIIRIAGKFGGAA